MHVDKHQAFLKVDVTGFGKQGKSSSKYLKLKVCKIFAIYQERMRNEVDFFFVDKHQSVLEVETVFIDGCGQACPIYRDNFALSSQYLKEKDRNILIFSM